ncbi:hypothetical protein VNO77_44541 [Canavalia gladiata]|uniref:Uncharacterized protein n=1 Tax=Canavalia gladiata TaxID=3824 RepID=A0AAN9JZ55_CANGL
MITVILMPNFFSFEKHLDDDKDLNILYHHHLSTLLRYPSILHHHRCTLQENWENRTTEIVSKRIETERCLNISRKEMYTKCGKHCDSVRLNK